MYEVVNYFNPRSRMGSDQLPVGRVQALTISIHAPAWGATGADRRRCGQAQDFNPRSRMGSDGRDLPFGHRVPISIHAPAWGATYRDGITTLQLIISIHAPAWGATDGNAEILLQARFQSTLPHGERPAPWAPARACAYFNPRSRMGSDSY